jgi:hypothetical protein
MNLCSTTIYFTATSYHTLSFEKPNNINKKYYFNLH